MLPCLGSVAQKTPPFSATFPGCLAGRDARRAMLGRPATVRCSTLSNGCSSMAGHTTRTAARCRRQPREERPEVWRVVSSPARKPVAQCNRFRLAGRRARENRWCSQSRPACSLRRGVAVASRPRESVSSRCPPLVPRCRDGRPGAGGSRLSAQSGRAKGRAARGQNGAVRAVSSPWRANFGPNSRSWRHRSKQRRATPHARCREK